MFLKTLKVKSILNPQIRVLKYLSSLRIKIYELCKSNEDLERFYFPYLWVYHRKI